MNTKTTDCKLQLWVDFEWAHSMFCGMLGLGMI